MALLYTPAEEPHFMLLFVCQCVPIGAFKVSEGLADSALTVAVPITAMLRP